VKVEGKEDKRIKAENLLRSTEEFEVKGMLRSYT
jgi:hypothetical protein